MLDCNKSSYDMLSNLITELFSVNNFESFEVHIFNIKPHVNIKQHKSRCVFPPSHCKMGCGWRVMLSLEWAIPGF